MSQQTGNKPRNRQKNVLISGNKQGQKKGQNQKVAGGTVKKPAADGSPGKRPFKKRYGKFQKQRKQKTRKQNTIEDKSRDLRNDGTTISGNTAVGLVAANDSLVITQTLPTGPVEGVAIGIMSFLLQRGFQNFTQTSLTPFYALTRLTQLLLQASVDGTPLSGTVPKWVALLAQALKTKTVNDLNGKATFTFKQTATGYECPTVIPMFSGGAWVSGVLSGSYINTLWPEVNTTATYDDGMGQAALQEFYQFARGLKDATEFNQEVAMADPNEMSNDPAAFAVCSGDPGAGQATVGGARTVIASEVPIKAPVFSVFLKPTAQLALPAGRSAMWVRAHGGDSIALGGLLAGCLNTKSLKFKMPPTYKAVDFWEFVDQLALIYRNAVQLALDDGQNIQVLGVTGNSPALYTLPMTFQEFYLMFRNVMMVNFIKSQYFSQGIVPSNTLTSQARFNTLKCSANTYGNPGCVGMQLPIAFIEQMRANTMRWNVGGKKGEYNPNMFIPVLGVYTDENIQGSSYTVTFAGESYPIFAPPPTTKGLDGKTVTLETAIDVIDGKAGNVYCFINEPESLQGLVDIWNKQYSMLKPFIDKSAPFTVDGGVGVLSQVIQTRHILITDQLRKKNTAMRDRLKKLTSSAYLNKAVAGVTCAEIPFTSAYQFTSSWISPTSVMEQDNVPDGNTNFQKISAANKEIFQIAAGVAGGATMTLAELHANFALTVTHSRNGQDSEMTTFVDHESQKGHGGILSSLASQFVAPMINAGVTAGISMIPF